MHPSLPPRLRALAVLTILLSAGTAAETSAPVTTPVASDAAFLAAVARAPEVAAARDRLRAARERARVAGALPQPRLGLDAKRMPRAGSNGLEATLEQELPRWGERDAALGRAAADVALAQAMYARTWARIAAEAARGIAAADLRFRSADLLDEATRRTTALVEARLASAAAGGGAATDEILDLRTRLDDLAIDALDLRRRAEDARDAARAALALTADAPLPAVPSPDPALASAEHAPDVAEARARAAQAVADGAAARAAQRPGFSVGVGWKREDLADERGDEVHAMLGIALPIDRRVAGAQAAAARADADAARREHAAAVTRAEAAVARARRGIEQAAFAHERATAIAARLEAAIRACCIDAGVAGAQMQGEGDFARVIDRLDELAAARRRAIAAELDALDATAELYAVLPPPEP